MFFDEVSLELEGGRGGNGAVSFHREKFVAYGPPDGGDGGKGGSVVVIADSNLNTFRHFAGKKHFKAERGGNGAKNNMAGKGGSNLELTVPVGTLVFDAETDDLIVDLKANGNIFEVAKGGRGGYGNAHFVSSTRQAPKFAELGDIGEHRRVRLELRLVADVGLLGFPSAGKSTLISHVSSAKPKIGDYPFTTLVPNLGVVYLSEFGGSREQTFVIADMPGIIEGASEGKGLGGKFLKHISRSAILVYLLDPFSYEDRSLSEQYKILHAELKAFDPELLEKDYFLVMNKIDAIPEEDREELKSEFLKDFPKLKSKLRMLSGVSGEGLGDFMIELWNLVQKKKEKMLKVEEVEEVPEYKAIKFVDEQSFEVESMYEVDVREFEKAIWGKLISDDNMPKRRLFTVTGKRIEQISRMTNVELPEAIQRIYDVLNKMGIQDELRKMGAQTGDLIKIGPHFYEFHDLDL